MDTPADLRRLAAFAEQPGGGNPAGVCIGDALPDHATMQRIATEVGYSETAFVAPRSGRRRRVRYFSPQAEVPFCGHATIAAGVAVAGDDGDGRFEFDTAVGLIPVHVHTDPSGTRRASLTSVEPRSEAAVPALVDAVLGLLGWSRPELDERLPPARAYAGAWHLVLAAAQRARLDTLDYDFDALRTLMLAHGLTTLQLVWQEHATLFHARNPFPVGGVVEDPATGAAAAALGGYLRALQRVAPPVGVTILQGERMGRPSRIHIEVPVSGGIVVTGAAVALNEEPSA